MVIGGFAINPLGLVRATDDLGLLIARDAANQALVKKSPGNFAGQGGAGTGHDDLAHWVVVRVNDDITVDLMTEAGGVTYEDARGGIEVADVAGVGIPFAGAELMLKMKQGSRGKDSADRSFLQQLLKGRRAQG